MPSPQEYLDAALALLDEHGPADPSLAFSVKAVTAGAGVNRTTIYRHWDTVAELNEDMAVYAVVEGDGWQRRVLEQPVDRSLADILEEAIAASAPEPGLAVRLMVPSWGPGSSARARVEAWDAAWLDAFTGWLDAHLAAVGRALVDGTPTRVLAISLAAVVEGHLVVDLFRGGLEVDEWDVGHATAIAVAAEDLFGGLTALASAPATGASSAAPVRDVAPSRLLPVTGFSAAKSRIFGQVLPAFRADPFGGDCSPEPARLVDMARLARRLGVTERRLYDVWPTIADCNADLVEAIAHRSTATVEDLMGEILDLGIEGPPDEHAFLVVDGLNRAVLDLVRPGRAYLFTGALAAADPVVRRAMQEHVDDWLGTVRTLYLALLSMTGWYRRVDIPAAEAVSRAVAVVVGLQRLVNLHPELAEEQGSIFGIDAPLCGLVGALLARTLTTAEPPVRRDPGGPVAPPLSIGGTEPS